MREWVEVREIEWKKGEGVKIDLRGRESISRDFGRDGERTQKLTLEGKEH